MEKTEILVKVQDIFRDVLDNEEIVLIMILLPMTLRNGTH